MFSRSLFAHREFKYLGAFYLHSLIRLFAIALFQIFNGIYIYQVLTKLGLSSNQVLSLTCLIFTLLFLINVLSIAPALWVINKKGLRFSVFLGNIFLVAFYISLYLANFDPFFILVSSIFGGLQISFYWIAYHLYFVELTDDQKQGRELSINAAISAVASIGGPAFGGLLIIFGSFNALFLVMIILVIIAIYPLKYLPKRDDKVEIDIIKTITALSPRKEFKSYLTFFGQSMTGYTFMIFWPLFTLPILKGVVDIGFMGSINALVATIVALGIGFLVDKFGPKRIVSFTSIIDSLMWVIMSFVSLPWQVYYSSSLSVAFRETTEISLDTMVYERARHSDFVAFIIQRELALGIGRLIFFLPIGILLWFGLAIQYVFLMAAAAVLLTRLYPFRLEKS